MKRIFKNTIPQALIAMIVMVVFLFAACAPATVPGESDVSLTPRMTWPHLLLIRRQITASRRQSLQTT